MVFVTSCVIERFDLLTLHLNIVSEVCACVFISVFSASGQDIGLILCISHFCGYLFVRSGKKVSNRVECIS